MLSYGAQCALRDNIMRKTYVFPSVSQANMVQLKSLPYVSISVIDQVGVVDPQNEASIRDGMIELSAFVMVGPSSCETPGWDPVCST